MFKNETEFKASGTEKELMNRVLEGLAYYSSVHTPNTSLQKIPKFANTDPYFIVNLALDKQSELAKAESYGLKIFEPEGIIPCRFVKIKRKILGRKQQNANFWSKENPKGVRPEVVDSQQKPIPPSILIGNGSKVLCKFGTYWFDNEGGGVNTNLFKVQVRELVRYTPSDTDLINDPSGFSIDAFEKEDRLAEFLDTLPAIEDTPTKAKVASGGKKMKESIFD